MPSSTVTLFLCGDVMPGRGVDQILRHSCDSRLEEGYAKDAGVYVALAEQRSGPLPRRVEPAYVWGDALGLLEAEAPAARVINLETSLTRSEERWPDKGIHYRLHPANVDVLRAAGIDVCVLANNHVLDHGRKGLEETLGTLRAAGLATAGAGLELAQARAPAERPLPGGARLRVHAVGAADSGIPDAWAAAPGRPGVELVPELTEECAAELAARVRATRRAGDVAVVSIHWGDNWGYRVPEAHRRFAHALIDGGVDLVHGHSSHHPRPLELYRGHLVLYGCGDFLNDYEGISGHAAYRAELVLMYLATLEVGSGELRALRMHPLRIRRFRLQHAPDEAPWLAGVLDVESGGLGVRVLADAGGVLRVEPAPAR